MAEASSVQKTSIYAILSLIFAFIFSPLGLIFGIIALVQIKNNSRLSGKGLAIAGVIISSLFIIIILIAAIGAFFYFNSLSPEKLLPPR